MYRLYLRPLEPGYPHVPAPCIGETTGETHRWLIESQVLIRLWPVQGVCRAPDTTCAQTTALICAFSDGSCIDLSPGTPAAGLYCVDTVGGSCSVSNKQARALTPTSWVCALAPATVKHCGHSTHPRLLRVCGGRQLAHLCHWACMLAACGLTWGCPMCWPGHNSSDAVVTPCVPKDVTRLHKLPVCLLLCFHMQHIWHALTHPHAGVAWTQPLTQGVRRWCRCLAACARRRRPPT